MGNYESQEHSSFHSDFEVLDQNKENNYYCLRERKSGRALIGKKVCVNDKEEDEIAEISAVASEKIRNPSPFVHKLLWFDEGREDSYCTTQTAFSFLYEKPARTLFQEIDHRMRNSHVFTQQEIEMTIYRIAKGLRYLYDIGDRHGCVQPSSVAWPVHPTHHQQLKLMDIWALNVQQQSSQMRLFKSLETDSMDKSEQLAEDLRNLGHLALTMFKCGRNLRTQANQINAISSPSLSSKLMVLGKDRISQRLTIYELLEKSSVEVTNQNSRIGTQHPASNSLYGYPQKEAARRTHPLVQQSNPTVVGSSFPPVYFGARDKADRSTINRQFHPPAVKTNITSGNNLINRIGIAHDQNGVSNLPYREYKVPSNLNSRAPASTTIDTSASPNLISSPSQLTRPTTYNDADRLRDLIMSFTNNYTPIEKRESITIPLRSLTGMDSTFKPSGIHRAKTNPFTSAELYSKINANIAGNSGQTDKHHQNTNSSRTSTEEVIEKYKGPLKQLEKSAWEMEKADSSLLKGNSSEQFGADGQTDLKYKSTEDIGSNSGPKSADGNITKSIDIKSTRKNCPYSTITERNNESGNSVEEEESEFVIEDYENGSRYEGFKSGGLRNGTGKFYYQEGSYYDGQWKNNNMHGYGRLYYTNSKPAYEGEWFFDQFHGQGKVYNDDPTPFTSPFNYTNFEDLEEKWDYYQGTLVSDSKEGFGKLVLSNGEFYEGEFRNDRVHGKGKFYTMDGKIISGIWKNSILYQRL